MAGTKFVLDEEKVLREGKYDLDAMYRFIDEVAKKAQLQKIAKITMFSRARTTWRILGFSFSIICQSASGSPQISSAGLGWTMMGRTI